jgi:hypothetical protein
MKFLKEFVEGGISHEILAEATTGKKNYYITGVFMEADNQNRNGRVYPLKTMLKAVEDYRQKYINTRTSLSELSHPDRLDVSPNLATHLITDLWQDGNKIMGKALVLETAAGKDVKALLDAGVQLSVSSRGIGSLTEKNGIKEVGEDFVIRAIDIVMSPSCAIAQVNPIFESKEFTLNESGNIVEITEEMEKQILEKNGCNRQCSCKDKETKEEPKKEEKMSEEQMLKMFENMTNSINPKLIIESAEPFHVYDNGGETQDRYTIFHPNAHKEGLKTKKPVEALAMDKSPTHPQGFSQMTSAQVGKHLGKKIKFSSLSDDLQKHIHSRLGE